MPRRSQKKKEPTAWEVAKPVLTQEILNGNVPNDMHPDIVHRQKPIYQAVKRENFKTNLKALRKRINVNMARARGDEAAVAHDKIVQRNRNVVAPPSKKPRWDGSMSKAHLKALIARGDHVGQRPRELYALNENSIFEEEGFTLTDIRKHIQQELSSTRVSGYWLAKKRRNKNNPPMVAGIPTPSAYNNNIEEEKDEDDDEGSTDDEIE